MTTTIPGAIRHLDDLQALVIEARRERKAIHLYLIGQLGYITHFYITSRSRLLKPGAVHNNHTLSHHMIPGWKLSTLGNERFYEAEFFPGDFGVGTHYDNEHATFTNRRLAERYSTHLATDPSHRRRVREHWARCDRLFGSIWE